MIQANELRIGNWVKMPFLGDVNLIVFGLAVKDDMSLFIQSKSSSGSTFFENLEKYEPIRITEECLFKFGFEKSDHDSGGYKWYKGMFYILELAKDAFYCDYTLIFRVDHIHQLQNLYFALTGKELTLSVT